MRLIACMLVAGTLLATFATPAEAFEEEYEMEDYDEYHSRKTFT